MTDITAHTTDLAPVLTRAPLEFAYSPAELKAWAAQLDDMKRSVLRPGSDYAVIPGTDKPTLLKPGAERLLMAAGMTSHQTLVAQTEQGLTYKCAIRRAGQVVAECDGYAGYDESRYYQSAAVAEAKERADARRWQRDPREHKFVEYRAPWNSVSKMAQKRALVGATLIATCTSGLFTQDLEDQTEAPGESPWNTPASDQIREACRILAKQLATDEQKQVVRAAMKQDTLPPSNHPDFTHAHALRYMEIVADALDRAPAPEASPSPNTVSAAHSPVTAGQAASVYDVARHGPGFPVDDDVLRVLIWGATDGRSDVASDVHVGELDGLLSSIHTLRETGDLPFDFGRWEEVWLAERGGNS